MEHLAGAEEMEQDWYGRRRDKFICCRRVDKLCLALREPTGIPGGRTELEKVEERSYKRKEQKVLVTMGVQARRYK